MPACCNRPSPGPPVPPHGQQLLEETPSVLCVLGWRGTVKWALCCSSFPAGCQLQSLDRGSDSSPGPVPIFLPPQLLWELRKPGHEAVIALCWPQAFGLTEEVSYPLANRFLVLPPGYLCYKPRGAVASNLPTCFSSSRTIGLCLCRDEASRRLEEHYLHG